MRSITLEEILKDKEQRVRCREKMLKKYNCPIVTYSLNLAGSRKRSILSDRVFYSGCDTVQKHLGIPVDFEITDYDAGLWAVFVYDKDAAVLKNACAELENCSVGQVFDFDVTDEHGKQIYRTNEQHCDPCSEPSAEVEQKTREILVQYIAEKSAIGARDALLEVLELTPKPGLADSENNGAHPDIDHDLFRNSAEALVPFFEHAVLIGFNGGDFAQLEEAGKAAETAMLAATGGKNTHKGAIFQIGIMLCAYGKTLSDNSNVFDNATALAQQKVAPKDTRGAAVRKEFGIDGAVGEAKNGFKIAKYAAMDLVLGENPLRKFFGIMAETEDSGVLFHGGKEALDFVRESAKAALQLDDKELFAEAKRLDKEFIHRGISPNGSACNLALAIFIAKSILEA